jgi:hypothetical protein
MKITIFDRRGVWAVINTEGLGDGAQVRIEHEHRDQAVNVREVDRHIVYAVEHAFVDDPQVHVVGGGEVLCDLPMPPVVWPKGHRWVPLGEDAKREVTCPRCKVRLLARFPDPDPKAIVEG